MQFVMSKEEFDVLSQGCVVVSRVMRGIAMVASVHGVDWAFQVADEHSAALSVGIFQRMDGRRGIVLTHAPVIPLGAEKTVDKDDRTTLSLLLWLVQLICHSHAVAELCRRERPSAILSKGYATHIHRNDYVESIRNDQKKLLFRIVNTINKEQEIAAPMVMSYLMGHEACYTSHHYTPIYWGSFVSQLMKAFPHLKSS